MQLALLGVEVPVVTVPRRVQGLLLSPAQKRILEHVAEHGSIRSSEAGQIVHEYGTKAARLVRYGHDPARSLDHRRRYRAADGLEACKRLQARNLLDRDDSRLGVWIRPGDAT